MWGRGGAAMWSESLGEGRGGRREGRKAAPEGKMAAIPQHILPPAGVASRRRRPRAGHHCASLALPLSLARESDRGREGGRGVGR